MVGGPCFDCAARTIGATSVPSSSIERFIAAVSRDAVLILRRAADTYPYRQPLLMRAREDALAPERRTKPAFPGEIGRLAKLQEQVEFLREEIVIGPRVETE